MKSTSQIYKLSIKIRSFQLLSSNISPWSEDKKELVLLFSKWLKNLHKQWEKTDGADKTKIN